MKELPDLDWQTMINEIEDVLNQETCPFGVITPTGRAIRKIIDKYVHNEPEILD